MHLALNYLPFILGGILVILLTLIAARWTGAAAGLGASTGWVVFVVEVVGRRPFLRHEGSQVAVRNVIRVYRIESQSITGVALHTFRLGKDTCPAITTRTRRRAIPVLAYFGFDRDSLSLDLQRVSQS